MNEETFEREHARVLKLYLEAEKALNQLENQQAKARWPDNSLLRQSFLASLRMRRWPEWQRQMVKRETQ